MGPGIQELPDLLKDTQYANPEDVTNTGLQRPWKTDLPLFSGSKNSQRNCHTSSTILL